MIKVGIIGCGKIADQHAQQIKRISGCDIVGVCDSEELMAKQLHERFGARGYYSDAAKMLDETGPDVVHVTTPAQSHYALGKLCLEAGCHVYIEKPFTLNTAEAEELIAIANGRGLKLTAGHNVQFFPEMVRMRSLIREGFLGGPPVHMESVYCYGLKNDVYASAFLGDRNHWVRLLPGKLLHNVISHGISKIAEFMPGGHPRVEACGFTSEALRRSGANDIIDELRVIIHEGPVTAYFTFSSQISPMLHQFHVYGPENSLLVDHAHRTVIKMRKKSHKSYLNHFIPPYDYGMQYIRNSLGNVRQFLKRDFHFDYGMKTLIELFYKAAMQNAPLPISYDEILVTSRIMDDIFAQVYGNGQ